MKIIFENTWAYKEVSIIELSFAWSEVYERFINLTILGLSISIREDRPRIDAFGWGKSFIYNRSGSQKND